MPVYSKIRLTPKINRYDASAEIQAASGSLPCECGHQSKIRHLRWQCGQTLNLPQPYDGSAVIWPQITTPSRPQDKKPYDFSLMKSTTPKKFVTDLSKPSSDHGH